MEPCYVCNRMSFTRPFLLGPVFFRADRPPVLWRLSPGEGVIPLHGLVGINCKKGATTENQGAGFKYIGSGVYVNDCVCGIRHDMTTPPWWREKVMVYY